MAALHITKKTKTLDTKLLNENFNICAVNMLWIHYGNTSMKKISICTNKSL